MLKILGDPSNSEGPRAFHCNSRIPGEEAKI